MTIPPGEAEYPTIKCPSCGKTYDLRQLDVDDGMPPTYSCPECKVEIYQPDPEE